ncbi:MAG: radical SAM-associated putative lipoprotein [Rikenellaceae bacterium]|nr:radical SAM-associated putative lipoprotein [Rikenellaceae bacterium]
MKKIITKSLSIIGFTLPVMGCVPVMYGSPSTTYEVKGKVLDNKGNPINGIKIALEDDATDPNPYQIAESQSLENGDYKIRNTIFPRSKLYLSVEDIDGAENGGEFEEQTIELDFSKVEATGDKDAWHNGTKSIEKYIVMQEKSDEAQE